MKKEVIFYSGFSMEPPEQVELLENNKGKVLQNHLMETLLMYLIIKFYLFGTELKKLVFGNGVKSIHTNTK